MFLSNVILFTTLLLGCSRPGASFWDVFSISVALSLGAVLQIRNSTPGGSEARLVAKQDNKEHFKNHIISSIITSKDFIKKIIKKT